MEQKHGSLQGLLEQDMNAKAYFDSLPNGIRQTLSTASGTIGTMQQLRDYAACLMRNNA